MTGVPSPLLVAVVSISWCLCIGGENGVADGFSGGEVLTSGGLVVWVSRTV